MCTHVCEYITSFIHGIGIYVLRVWLDFKSYFSTSDSLSHSSASFPDITLSLPVSFPLGFMSCVFSYQLGCFGYCFWILLFPDLGHRLLLVIENLSSS